jgi:hypothetical protein
MNKNTKRTRIIIITGVFALIICVIWLVYVLFPDGYGGKSLLSYCLDTIIRPFPFVMVLSIIILIILAFKKPETNDK